MRDLEQAATAGERHGLEVGADAVGEHGHVLEHGDAQEVVDLLHRLRNCASSTSRQRDVGTRRAQDAARGARWNRA